MFGRYNFSQDAKHVPARLRERGRNSDLQDGLAQLVALEDAVAVVVAGLEEARGLRVESLRVEALRLARGIHLGTQRVGEDLAQGGDSPNVWETSSEYNKSV